MADNNRKRARILECDLEAAIDEPLPDDIDVEFDDSLDETYSPSESSPDEDVEDSGSDASRPNSQNDVPGHENLDDEDQWVEVENDPQLFPFTENEGLKVDISNDSSPLDIFSLMLDDELLKLILDVTNRKANALLRSDNAQKKEKRRKKSQLGNWKDITVNELKYFIALCIAMGNIKMPSLKHYWAVKNIIYHHPLFGKTMSRERFEIILKLLHFYDDETADRNERLHKIDFLQKILTNIRNLYGPGQNLSLDEAVLLWRGRLSFRQYLPNKKHKYGIKFYELCTPDGFILNLFLYQGKGTVADDVPHVQGVVLKLMENYLNKGHRLYMDNFYNSVELCEKLNDLKTNVCGTLRKNRKNNPKKVISEKLKKGQTIWQKKGNVLVLKWKDKREVLMISTMHKHQMVNVLTRRGLAKDKPNSVADYNKCMSGIDRSDQMIAYYSTPRKSLRWYMKVFFRFIDVCLWNGSYIYNKTHQSKIDYLKFRDAVVLEILNRMEPATPQRKAQHYPEQLEKRKRCKVCYENKKRTDTWFYCLECEGQPALCAAPCFKNWHLKKAR